MTLKYIHINNLNYSFSDGTELFQGLTLQFSGEKKIGIVGNNGVGKSTLIRLVREGELQGIKVSGNISYLPQNLLTSPILDLSTIEFDKRKYQFLNLLNLDEEKLYLNYEHLSGGEKIKLHLFKILMEDFDILILDEPTNNLDLDSKNILKKFINQKLGKMLIIVSHDRSLLNEMDEICLLTENGAQIFGGNYEFFKDAFESKMEQLLLLEKRITYSIIILFLLKGLK